MASMDEKYMRKALNLSKKGVGSVEPNPAVGCVIVKANQIIGQGWHKKFGEAHAEVNAIEDCKTLGANPKESTVYVTLEPCCHEGKTGPCTDALIEAGVKRVVVAMIDPSMHASGQGIEQLRNAGIEVEVGVCEDEAKIVNAAFVKFASTGKTWVVLKWAQSLDGKLAWSEGQENRWISNEKSRKDVQVLRKRVGAIVVGINTVLEDNPLLTVRPAKGHKPVRIVLDNSLRIRLGCKLLNTIKRAPVMVVTSRAAIDSNLEKASKLEKKGVELLVYESGEGVSNLDFLLDNLRRRQISQVLVEGGAKVLSSFIKEKRADEIVVYVSPKILGSQGRTELGEAFSVLDQSVELESVEIKEFEGDARISGLVKNS